MLTLGSKEAYTLMTSTLPARVRVQLLPTGGVRDVAAFLARWQPSVGILYESPLHPGLVAAAAAAGVPLALLNARIPSQQLLQWHGDPRRKRQLERMLRAFQLIVPQTDADTARFRMFGARLAQMPGWCTDLRSAASLGAGAWNLCRPDHPRMVRAKQRECVAPRPVPVTPHRPCLPGNPNHPLFCMQPRCSVACTRFCSSCCCLC